uniref:Uncharacterized protein n=1 Tax=Tanacetum cinerariifolium TaxID=118510 RepID=A0A699IX57_TANCI|nr:hypothetical protein [Tanacetum cinerariifolium]GEZ93658.1 hypothetical protein [Tanacetum cinerariifolium]
MLSLPLRRLPSPPTMKLHFYIPYTLTKNTLRMCQISFPNGLKEAFTRAPTQYKEYLSEFWYTTKTLEDSKVWVSTPTGGVRGDISITTFINALRADDISKKIMLEDLSEFLKDIRSAFFTPNSPQDEPIIVTDKSEEYDVDKEETHDTSHDMLEYTSVSHPPSLKSAQVQELMAQVKLPKASSFTSSSFFSSEIAYDFGFPSKSITQGQASASPAEGEKNTKDAETNLKDELIDLLGTNVMTQYYNKKLLFDKYCDKMVKRKKIHKITNCKVLTKKGPITLKIYKEDGSE